MAILSFGFTLLAFAVALGVLIFVHELGHFVIAKLVGVRVLRFSMGFGPIVWARRRGDTEYALSALPLGGYVKMLGEDESELEDVPDPERAFPNQSLGRRTAIVFAGPAMNFLFAFLAYVVLFGSFGQQKLVNEPVVGGVSAGYPAEAAGLQVGDRIVAVDGKPMSDWEGLVETVRASSGTLHLTIEREGDRFEVSITPMLDDLQSVTGESQGKTPRIGVAPPFEWETVSPWRAVTMGAQKTALASADVVSGLVLMIRGRVPMRELGGPIAIARVAGDQARAGLRYFLSTLAFLSINLAVLNLLPIPVLDGGHLAFFAIEAVIRRPLHQRHREIAQQVGLLLLITLMVFVFYNDINRLVQG